MILARDPLCRECKARDRLAPATVADHIRPISAGGSRFDLANGQGLCESCHNSKTRHEQMAGVL